jgi:hypothetical protein
MMTNSKQSELVDVELKVRIDVPGKKAIGFINGEEIKDSNGRKIRDKMYWLPRSLIEVHEEGRVTTVTMPRWLAEQEGLV